MLDFLIPEALAQGITGTVGSAATAGKDVAVGGAQTGIQALFSYFIDNIGNWIAALIIVVISVIIGNMAAAAAKKAIIKERDDVQESAIILVERMTKIVVITVGVTIAFAINGLNFTAVIGALSLGIGFALKDIIGNFISGVIRVRRRRYRHDFYCIAPTCPFVRLISIYCVWSWKSLIELIQCKIVHVDSLSASRISIVIKRFKHMSHFRS